MKFDAKTIIGFCFAKHYNTSLFNYSCLQFTYFGILSTNLMYFGIFTLIGCEEPWVLGSLHAWPSASSNHGWDTHGCTVGHL
jgi:hypothetical protein